MTTMQSLFEQRLQTGVTSDGRLTQNQFKAGLVKIMETYGEEVEKIKMQIALDLVTGGASTKRLTGAFFIFGVQGGGGTNNANEEEKISVQAQDVYSHFFKGRKVVLRQVAAFLNDEITSAYDVVSRSPNTTEEARVKCRANLSILIGSAAGNRVSQADINRYRKQGLANARERDEAVSDTDSNY